MLIGIVGQGSIGRRHALNARALGHTVITCDVNGGGDCLSLEELYSFPIKAVLVCTAPVFHYEHVMSAIEREIDCFCEKPLAMTSSQANDLLWRNDDHVTLAVGYQLNAMESARCFPRNWKVLHIWDKQNMGAWPLATYERDLLLEFSHELALALLWAGAMPGTATIDWRNAANCTIVLGWLDGRLAKIELSGDFDGYRRGAWSDVGSWEFSKAENDEAYVAEIEAFLCDAPYCTGEDALQVMRLIERLR